MMPEAGHPLTDVLQEAKSIAHELRRDMMPEMGKREATRVDATTMAQRDAQIVIAARKRLGERLLVTFKATHDYLQKVLAGCGPADWEMPCSHRTRVLTVRTLLDLRLAELAIHGWDIRSRLKAAALLFAESVPVLMDRIRARFETPGYGGFRLAPEWSGPVCYRFELKGIINSPHDILVENDRAHFESAGATTPQVIFRCETALFILMMYRRLSLDEALASGALSIEGDQALTLAFERWLQGE